MASKTSCYRHAIRDSRIATSANKLVGKLQAGIFLWSTKSARAVAWLLIQRLPFCSRLSKRLQEGTKTPRSSEVYIEAIAHSFLTLVAPGFTAAGGQSEKRMKRLIAAVALISFCVCQA